MNLKILDKFMEIAEKEIGVHEWETNDNPRIILYDKSTSLGAKSDHVPWCSSFVNWVVEQTSKELNIPDLVGTHSASARSWCLWGKEIKEPVRGCIVVMSRGTNPSLGHVGFFDKHNATGLTHILSGNWADSVGYGNIHPETILSYRIWE